MMHGRGKSDSAIVAGKPTNKAGQPAAEPVERRAEAKGNASQQSTRRAQDRESVSQALKRIRQVARQRKKERFTSLFHHISAELLRLAFFALKRDAAPGVDGLTWQDYEADLDRKIEDLHARVHRGAYRALPARRQYIPKADGQQRPLAVAALEDKIIQKAVCAVLNVIYEEDFLGFSYGFRPKRSQHDALDALTVGIYGTKVNYIFDADLRSFFDSVSQQWLVRFLKHRINDSRMLRLIQKWLKAGVLEDGVLTVSERGTGQGSVISPLLANVYLHYVFDLWAAMRDRLQEFSLSLHPEKARLIEFGRFAADRRAQRGLGKPETFNFLGFTFVCGTSRRGQFLIKRKTRRDRMRAKLREVKEGMRWRRHHSIPEQGNWLRLVVTGFFAYHAVPTNIWALGTFRFWIIDLWRRSLRRRSQKDRMTWQRITKLVDDFLPRARIRHPWPEERFAVKHPRWEPSARIGHARFCAGGA